MFELRPLTDTARRLLEGSDDARRMEFSPKLFVGYPEAIEVHDILEELINQPKSNRPLNLLLCGVSGNGKTSILETFHNRHPRRDNVEGDAAEIPVVRVDAPSNKRLMSLYLELMNALGAPNHRTALGRARLLEQGMSRTSAQPQIVAPAVLRLLVACSVKMVIIDEIHSLANKDKEYARETMLWIKAIPNLTGIPIVLGGEPDATNIRSDRQLANRFDVCELPVWQADTRTAHFLADLEAALPLRKRSNLLDPAIAGFLIGNSSGTIGSMLKLIIKAGSRAVGDTEQITLTGLQRAKSEGLRRRLEDLPPIKNAA